MTLNRFVRAASIFGLTLTMMAANAAAATITFNTNSPNTGFGGTTLSLNSTSGEAATLTFLPATDEEYGVPTNVNFGDFRLECPTCTTQLGGLGSMFAAFSFDLVITDITDTAVGTFVGESAGGTVYSDVSPITVNWSPLQLGPGTTNAMSGDFGPTTFTTTIFTGIVAPNSGVVPGQTTVQGFVNSASVSEVPEPATLGLVGAALLGLGLLRRKSLARS